jgi:DNA-binding CsgD family transcriptional regulator
MTEPRIAISSMFCIYGCWSGMQMRDVYLSAIELTILRYIALGFQSKEIAIEIKRSKPTVEIYVRFLCAKLGARSRAHLVTCAFRNGILQVDNDGTRASMSNAGGNARRAKEAS